MTHVSTAGCPPAGQQHLQRQSTLLSINQHGILAQMEGQEPKLRCPNPSFPFCYTVQQGDCAEMHHFMRHRHAVPTQSGAGCCFGNYPPILTYAEQFLFPETVKQDKPTKLWAKKPKPKPSLKTTFPNKTHPFSAVLFIRAAVHTALSLFSIAFL